MTPVGIADDRHALLPFLRRDLITMPLLHVDSKGTVVMGLVRLCRASTGKAVPVFPRIRGVSASVQMAVVALRIV